MSSSLEPDSSFAQSTAGESATTAQSHSKKKRSPVWAYCRDPTEDEDQELLYCIRYIIDYPEESPEPALNTCGGNPKLPAWITLDNDKELGRIIYCTDENWTGNGSLTSISAPRGGPLKELATVITPISGVHNSPYGDGFIAVAHYSASEITTWKLPLVKGGVALATHGPYNLTGPHPNAARQDASHPHGVHVDPTGKCLVSPDLGNDYIHVFSINPTSGALTECKGPTVAPGNGPRHGTFKKSKNGDTILYIGNEMGGTVTAFKVTYGRRCADACPTFDFLQGISSYPKNATAPTVSKLAEVHTSGEFLYVANRVDKSFSGNDSLATISLDADGLMTFKQLSDSYGTYPRTFQINKAGTLVAIGDQTTANLAVVKRNTETGLLGPLLASLRIGATGTPESEDGLSAVVWDE